MIHLEFTLSWNSFTIIIDIVFGRKFKINLCSFISNKMFGIFNQNQITELTRNINFMTIKCSFCSRGFIILELKISHRFINSCFTVNRDRRLEFSIFTISSPCLLIIPIPDSNIRNIIFNKLYRW